MSSCECGDETLCSGAMELVSLATSVESRRKHLN
jgi:hypothetical protein